MMNRRFNGYPFGCRLSGSLPSAREAEEEEEDSYGSFCSIRMDTGAGRSRELQSRRLQANASIVPFLNHRWLHSTPLQCVSDREAQQQPQKRNEKEVELFIKKDLIKLRGHGYRLVGRHPLLVKRERERGLCWWWKSKSGEEEEGEGGVLPLFTIPLFSFYFLSLSLIL
eukprot:gene13442-9253_t